MSYENIPVIVVLWENQNFTGKRVLISSDTPNLGSYGFNDKTSSIGIHPGPDYDPNKKYEISFFKDTDYKGGQLVLTQGAYPGIGTPYNFNDCISSIKFNYGIPPAPQIKPIPLVVELYEDYNFNGRKLVIMEDVPNLSDYSDFGNKATSMKVFKGPDYVEGKKVSAYYGNNYAGGFNYFEPGNYDFSGSPKNNDIQSIKIR